MSNRPEKWVAATVFAGLFALPAAAAPPGSEPGASSTLAQMSQAVQALVEQVSPSVVQVIVSGYGPVEQSADGSQPMMDRQRSVGAGAVVDRDGYIITNAHVVNGARRIQVVLPTHTDARGSAVRALVTGRGEIVDAALVGVAREIDLALLKVDRTGLTPLHVADYDAVKQGQLVFAFGSPAGMRNSVTMGVVSAVARQPHPDNPLVYVQTDAPINPGNSGGPLVNVAGELVGINTFIVSESGGSEGLSFAIPGPLVQMAYPRLKKFGHLHRGEMGVAFQTINPILADGLALPQDFGVIVADVIPGGPADVADLHVQDIVESVDGRPVESLPVLAFQLFTHGAGDQLSLGIRRGTGRLTLNLTLVEAAHGVDQLSEMMDPATSSVPRLGVVGIEVTDGRVGELPVARRVPSGILVGARIPAATVVDVPLSAGDVIHAVNGLPVTSIEGLRKAVDSLASHASLVLQVERNGALTYLSCQLD